MDDLNDSEHTSGPSAYPLWFRLVTLLLVLLGVGVFLMFGFFAFVTLPGESFFIGVWNLLVVVAEGWVLRHAIRHYFSATQPMSVTFFWIAVAAVGVPLIASGGCAFMADSFRIAG